MSMSRESTSLKKSSSDCLQDAQLSHRDRAAGYISFGRKWKTGTQRQYFTDIVSLASTAVTIGQQSYRIR